jgi:chromosome segregation ATPase
MGSSSSSGSEKDRKQLALEKKKSARLDEEVRGLQEKVRQLEDGGQKLVQRQQQVAALRKQLKGKEDRALEAGHRAAELEAENGLMKQRLSDSHNRMQQLEIQLATSQSAAASALSSAQRHQQQQHDGKGAEMDKELGALKRQASEAALEVQTLRAQLGEARRELRQARDAGTGPTGGSISRVTAEEQQLLKKLSAENKRLKDELSAFDLDFFEEIENLKYAHSEAAKLVKWYEKKFGKR